jgi:formylglycine-generating enzyme required for sulfatase activity
MFTGRGYPISLVLAVVLAHMADIAAAQLRDEASAPPISSTFNAAVTEPPVGTEDGLSFRDCQRCPDMVRLPPGRFEMGSALAETALEGIPEELAAQERPRHTVVVNSALAVGKFHVTRAEYAQFVAETGYEGGTGCYVRSGSEVISDPTRSWRNPGFPQTERDPVVCINWYDAKRYALWLSHVTGKSYRLLTEAEWEYAARAGTSTSRWWGDDGNAGCRFANGADLEMKSEFTDWTIAQCSDGHIFTSPVGSFEPNPFGLYDMLGNAWQWVEDCYHPDHLDARGDASLAVESGACSQRVVRGGSWNNSPVYLRAAARDGVGTGNRDSFNGFRVARTR